MQLSQTSVLLTSLMMVVADSPRPEDMLFAPIITPKPCLGNSHCWESRLCTITAPIPPRPVKKRKALIDKDTFELKELISENEAAFLFSLPAKTLGNRRRANEINRSLFIQSGPGCLVRYRKVELINAIRANTVFVRVRKK